MFSDVSFQNTDSDSFSYILLFVCVGVCVCVLCDGCVDSVSSVTGFVCLISSNIHCQIYLRLLVLVLVFVFVVVVVLVVGDAADQHRLPQAAVTACKPRSKSFWLAVLRRSTCCSRLNAKVCRWSVETRFRPISSGLPQVPLHCA